MKKLICLLLLCGANIMTAQKVADLKVEVTGLETNNGKVYIGLCNNKDAFLKIIYKGLVAKISNNTSVAVFKDLPVGEYAVTIFHDENNNEKLDTNFMGIPIEDYGASNNAKGFMGPPKYNDAKFNLQKNKTIIIKI